METSQNAFDYSDLYKAPHSLGKLIEWKRVSESAVSEWRRGNTRPSIDKVDALINALDALKDKKEFSQERVGLLDILEHKYPSSR